MQGHLIRYHPRPDLSAAVAGLLRGSCFPWANAVPAHAQPHAKLAFHKLSHGHFVCSKTHPSAIRALAQVLYWSPRPSPSRLHPSGVLHSPLYLTGSITPPHEASAPCAPHLRPDLLSRMHPTDRAAAAMVASKVFIARHGERIDHVDPLWKTRVENTDDPFLTERGLAQAQCLGQRLADEGIVKIFVSPFYRTIQTAAAVAKTAKAKMCIEPGICEALLPEFFPEGYPRLRAVADLAKEFPSIDPTYVPVHVPEYPETKTTTIERVKTAAKKIIQKEQGPILLVGHGITCEGSARGLIGDQPIAYIDYCALMQLDRTETSGAHSYAWAGTCGPDVTYIQDQAIR